MNKKILYLLLLLIVAVSVRASNTITGMITYFPSETQENPVNNVLNNFTNNNYIIINITNNITNNITQQITHINNITNEVTTYVNTTSYVTNNITTEIYQNVTNNISNNFYSGWLTIENNITNNITTYCNITEYNNITNNIIVENNFTNNITNYVNLTYNIELSNNVSTNITLNIFNITQYYNATPIYEYCDAKINELNVTINEHEDEINSLNNSIYGELYGIDIVNISLITRYSFYKLTNFINGEYSNVILANDSIIINNSGLYFISYSIMGVVIGPGEEIVFINRLNGVNVSKSISARKFDTGLNTVVSFSYFQRMNNNDILELYASDSLRNNVTLTLKNRNLIIQKIGD